MEAMNISQTTTYAIKAMVHIARDGKNKYIKSAEISSRHKIPKSYLFKVMTNLQLAGIIKSKRGKRGGYFLAKNADQITLLDIFRATDSSLTQSICLLGKKDCGGITECKMHSAWARANDQIDGILNGFSLEMLRDRELGIEFDLVVRKSY